MAKKTEKTKPTPTDLVVAYNVIQQPHITEKATSVSQFNQYVFKVSPDATKPQIRKAIEDLFGVKVEGVNTINIKGKHKRFRGKPGQRQNVRKAIVTLAEGQSIDMQTGV